MATMAWPGTGACHHAKAAAWHAQSMAQHCHLCWHAGEAWQRHGHGMGTAWLAAAWARHGHGMPGGGMGMA